MLRPYKMDGMKISRLKTNNFEILKNVVVW
jgi:hypothetical protein